MPAWDRIPHLLEEDEIDLKATGEVIRCPLCLVAGVERKTKLVCPNCNLILENCCGD